MLEKDLCFIPCSKNEEELKGAFGDFQVGKKLHYNMGGTISGRKDLMIRHFLQDQVTQIGTQKCYEF